MKRKATPRQQLLEKVALDVRAKDNRALRWELGMVETFAADAGYKMCQEFGLGFSPQRPSRDDITHMIDGSASLMGGAVLDYYMEASDLAIKRMVTAIEKTRR